MGGSVQTFCPLAFLDFKILTYMAVFMKKVIFNILFLVVFCSCQAKTQDKPSNDISKLFADAGINLLKEAVTPEDFTLPLMAPASMPVVTPDAVNLSKTQSLGELKGKVVFLNFWATWCGPCREEMPSMEALHKRYGEKGFEILAVNCMEDADAAFNFMRNNRLTFPVVLDQDGKVSGKYGIRGIPTTYLINREGKIIARVVGSLNWDTPKMNAALEVFLSQ